MSNEMEYRLSVAGDEYEDYVEEIERLDRMILTHARYHHWTSFWLDMAYKWKLQEKLREKGGSDGKDSG